MGGPERGGTPTRWLVIAASPGSQLDAESVTAAMVALGGRAVWESGDRLVTHLADPPDPEEVVRALRLRLADDGRGRIEVETWWQPHADWAEIWKRGLAPRRIGDRLLVTPTWCDPAARPKDLVIRLDPGMAFGTAEHGTTRGCLRLLESAVHSGDRILDVGSGSGILSIAAALLGSPAVMALDGDPYAVEAARANAELNGVGSSILVREAWVSAAWLVRLEPRDGVVVNIESGVLRDLLPGLGAAVGPGGWLILGGIADHELDGLEAEVLATGLKVDRVDADGEWRSVLCRY